MTDDPVARLKAGLDADERYLQSNRQHLWIQRPLREVAAKRKILAIIDEAEAASDAVDTIEISSYVADDIRRALAAVYGDDDT